MAARDDCDNSRMVLVDQHPNPCMNTNSPPPPSTAVTVKLNFSAGWGVPALASYILYWSDYQAGLPCPRGRAAQNVPYRLGIYILYRHGRIFRRPPAKERYNNSPLLLAPLVPRAGIFKQSMGSRNQVGTGLSYWPARLHRLRNSFLGIDSWAL